MPHFVDYTKQLCAALRSVPLTLVPEDPQVPMFHLRFNMNGESLALKIITYGERTGIIVLPLPRSGNEQSCTCEISIGDQAIAHEPDYWAKHIQVCLAQ
jgi:hypothetical protein